MLKSVGCLADYTACIRFAVPGGTVEIQIQPDPDPPSWLGRFSQRRVSGAVRSGLDVQDKPYWYVPDIPAGQIEAALLALHGRRRARQLAHERIRADRLRLAEYGKTWSQYRLTVSVCRPGQPPIVETLAGLAAHDLPLIGNTRLAEQLVADLLNKPPEREPSGF